MMDVEVDIARVVQAHLADVVEPAQVATHRFDQNRFWYVGRRPASPGEVLK